MTSGKDGEKCGKQLRHLNFAECRTFIIRTFAQFLRGEGGGGERREGLAIAKNRKRFMFNLQLFYSTF